MFSEQVLEHFRNPRNSGELACANARAEVANPVCGDVLQLFAIVREGKFERVTFLCRGCTTSIACASWLTERLCGQPLDEARRLTCDEIAAGLGGLPPATVHAAQLAIDALKALAAESAR
jgi:nitrogen fixation protein NifU and related proteins